MNPSSTNDQVAPFPRELEALLPLLEYKDGWDFRLFQYDRGQGSEGLTLVITIETPNSYAKDTIVRVKHLMPVPPAAFSEGAWRRWLLDQILLVEQHEACEFFTLDGEKPFAPLHGPGENPYVIVEYATDTQRRTRFTGEVKP